MNATLLLMVASVVGVDVGWQTGSDGTLEYIIQIEPELLESLRSGGEIISDVPPALRGMSSYRIRIGSGALPHDPLPDNPAEEPNPPDVPSDVPVGTGDATNDRSADRGAAVTNQRPPFENLSRWPAINARKNLDADTEPSAEADPPVLAPSATDGLDFTESEPAPKSDPQRQIAPNRFDVGVKNPQPVQPAVNIETSEDPLSKEGKEANNNSPDNSNGAGSTAGSTAGPIVDPERWPEMLILAVIGLFVSFGANLYLGWITYGLRSRYLGLVEVAAMQQFAKPTDE